MCACTCVCVGLCVVLCVLHVERYQCAQNMTFDNPSFTLMVVPKAFFGGKIYILAV